MKSLTLRIIAVVFSILVVAGAAIALTALDYLKSPVSRTGVEKVVTIQPGKGFNAIVDQLAVEGVIQDRWKFKLLGKVTGKASRVQAGEFRLRTGWTPPRILETLVSGSPVMHQIRIPEGLTWWQTAEAVAATGLTTFPDFKAVVHDSDLLAKWHIPADSAEGFLFPETYTLPRPRDKSALPIVEAMLKSFWKAADSIWTEGRPDPEELMRIVIIASLVEKETSLPEERPVVAGVYVNRLQRGMLLQADPTIIYGLGTAFDGNLKRSHLRDEGNPYNTYRHPGLPPGPICSPGLASLQAAANPDDHRYLYFVAKGDGSHQFSRTLVEHNRAVRKYQLRR